MWKWSWPNFDQGLLPWRCRFTTEKPREELVRGPGFLVKPHCNLIESDVFRLYVSHIFPLLINIHRASLFASMFRGSSILWGSSSASYNVRSGGWRWRHVHAVNVARGEHSHFGFPWESTVVLFHVCITLDFSGDGSVRPQSTGSAGQMGSLLAGPHHLPLRSTDSVISSVCTPRKHVD
jgi:hypothetical protein